MTNPVFPRDMKCLHWRFVCSYRWHGFGHFDYFSLKMNGNIDLVCTTCACLQFNVALFIHRYIHMHECICTSMRSNILQHRVHKKSSYIGTASVTCLDYYDRCQNGILWKNVRIVYKHRCYERKWAILRVTSRFQYSWVNSVSIFISFYLPLYDKAAVDHCHHYAWYCIFCITIALICHRIIFNLNKSSITSL